MKQQTIVLLSILLITLHTSAQKSVGIGTNTPHTSALLHIDVDTSTSQGFLVAGTTPASAPTVPDLGAGRRMSFYPGKAAFRAGQVLGTQWDDANVGRRSVAFGFNTIASGEFSTAMGLFSTASGIYSTSFGRSTTAKGPESTAMGGSTVAKGLASTAMGYGTTAKGYATTVVGIYNDSLMVNDEDLNGPAGTTPLFIVGNGEYYDYSNAFVVRKNGTVGVGNIVPEFTLDVANRMRLRGATGDPNNTAGIWFNNVANTGTMGFMGVYNDNTLGLYGPGAFWGLVMNTTSGNVGIGTVNPSQRLQVIGNITATGTIASSSDIRYKTNFLPPTSALSPVMQIQPIYYNWKQEFKDKGFTGERQLGFSAQEIEKFFPEIVQTDKDGYKAVDYSRMTPVLVQAVKEQQGQIETLKKENAELRARLERIETLLKADRR